MKAQIQMQFNWLYVGLVGVVILLMFLGLFRTAFKSSDQTLEIDSRMILKNIISSVPVTGAYDTVDLQQITLSVDCATYQTGDIGSENIEYTPIFSPRTIRDEMITSSMDWDVPFYVQTHTYLTSPHITYIIEDTPMGEELFALMPPVSKELSDLDDAQGTIRYITFDQGKVHLPLSASQIDIQGDLYSGKVTYYLRNQKMGTYPYLGESLLLGAVFAEHDLYACNVEKALPRLRHTAELMHMIVDAYPDEHCPYEKTLDALHAMQSAGINNLETLRQQKNTLLEENSMLRTLSCPLPFTP